MTNAADPSLEELRIAITTRCDLSCVHCYSSSGDSETRTVSLGHIENCIRMAKATLGLRHLSLTGGEPLHPLVRDDLLRLLHIGQVLDLSVRVCTHGGFATSEVAEIIRDVCPKAFLQISLDSSVAERHDVFRGRIGSFQRAVNGIKASVAVGLPVKVRYTLTKENLADAVKCYEMTSSLGAFSFVAKVLFPIGYAAQSTGLIPSTQAVCRVQMALIEISDTAVATLELPPPIFFDTSALASHPNAQSATCSCGLTSAYVDSRGLVYPCNYLIGMTTVNKERFAIGDITLEGFDLGSTWQGAKVLVNFRHTQKSEKVCCFSWDLVQSEIAE